MIALAELIKQCDAQNDLLRRLVISEEDRAKFTASKPSGEYRWFEAPNVICIEKARRLRSRD
ncbi:MULTISPECIES: hypothetical protein [unclassified Bradyrhizobium]|uniref:hypothetical protein n=1 Tax=unclassified Bradyrhizobium TaxID=2631580 RepID=UPI0028EE0B24|nr:MULTISPECIES: hypothetical protein [unclassified Bradyrhizobium]